MARSRSPRACARSRAPPRARPLRSASPATRKPGVRPAALRVLAQDGEPERVEGMDGDAAASGPSSACRRSRISAAARRVKVMARHCAAGTPRRRRDGRCDGSGCGSCPSRARRRSAADLRPRTPPRADRRRALRGCRRRGAAAASALCGRGRAGCDGSRRPAAGGGSPPACLRTLPTTARRTPAATRTACRPPVRRRSSSGSNRRMTPYSPS